MDRKLELILGNEHIFNWFGYWPSFHDAEIHWIKLQRAVPLRGNSANIELMTHTWELTEGRSVTFFMTPLRRKNTMMVGVPHGPATHQDE